MLPQMFDNIVAISSGLVNQPIGIIRLTGPNVIEIVKNVFEGKIGKNKEITYGYIVENKKNSWRKKIIDEVLIAWFTEKDNFVGQKLVEVYCHGGIVVMNILLQLFISNGARLAEPGEFSKIAFLNGKMNLIKAEAINDLIFSKTKKQAKISIQKLKGNITKTIEKLIERIIYLIGVCEINIDYPEYNDIEDANNSFLTQKLNEIIKEMEEIIYNSEKSELFFVGLKILIVGKPNVGKSSIFNLLLKEEKAIVTEIPGTTRDFVEGEIYLENINFKIIDTAGVRNSKNKIEKIGIERTLNKIKESDIILHILDERRENDFDKKIKDLSKGKKYMKIYNKKDLLPDIFCKNNKCVSSKNGDIKKIRENLKKFIPKENINFENCLNNSRQIGLIKKALLSIKNSKKAIRNGHDVGTIIIDIREAWESLQSILGNSSEEVLLDKIFSSFCLGK